MKSSADAVGGTNTNTWPSRGSTQIAVRMPPAIAGGVAPRTAILSCAAAAPPGLGQPAERGARRARQRQHVADDRAGATIEQARQAPPLVRIVERRGARIGAGRQLRLVADQVPRIFVGRVQRGRGGEAE